MAARKKAEKELSKEMILEAARKLFVQHGYRNTSMRQLAKALDCTHGALYYHFKNKAELYYALVQRDFALLDRKLEEVIREGEMDNRKKLERIFLGYIEFGLTHQSHYEIMFLIKDEELQRHLQQEPNQSYERFAQAVFSLSGGKVTPAVIWSVFLSLHGFVAHYCKSGQTYEDVQGLAKSHVAFLLAALA